MKHLDRLGETWLTKLARIKDQGRALKHLADSLSVFHPNNEKTWKHIVK